MGGGRSGRRFTATATFLIAAVLAGGAACGGGESVISGVGNMRNQIGTAAVWASLADELADHPATPVVTDEEIDRVYAVVRERAFAGNLEAALVLLKLAEEQREED